MYRDGNGSDESATSSGNAVSSHNGRTSLRIEEPGFVVGDTGRGRFLSGVVLSSLVEGVIEEAHQGLGQITMEW